jgi:branched-chain amino acid transport system permease protein
MSVPANASDAGAGIAAPRIDRIPILLLVALMAIAVPLVGSGSTWLTLTAAGLAMGMILFIVAAGLMLVFGLMDVLNFAHGVFIAIGGYLAATILTALSSAVSRGGLALALGAIFAAIFAALGVAAVVGLVFERFVVRPAYGRHLTQILVTMGGMIVGEELITAIWGAQLIPVPLPDMLRGAVLVGGAAVEKFRLLAVVVGLVVLAALGWTLNRTRIGLLVRAGVEDREMVESLGYRVRRLFVGVFVAGAALAGAGGALWAMYQQGVVPQMGSQINVLIFIVVIIGGLGSTLGCLVGAMMVALVANYTGFLLPKAALFSNIALMVAILLWRPRGMYPLGGR